MLAQLFEFAVLPVSLLLHERSKTIPHQLFDALLPVSVLLLHEHSKNMPCSLMFEFAVLLFSVLLLEECR